MKKLATLLTLITLVLPAHAASPRTCRTTTASRVNHVRVVATLHSVKHHASQPHFVVTTFAVPVAVPVAPFAPYWYGLSEYYAAPSFPGRASEPERAIIAQRCTSCHGRTSPKQGLSLVDLPSLSAEDRLRAISAVVNGEMPPDTEPPLTDADRTALLRELISGTVAIEQNQNDQ